MRKKMDNKTALVLALAIIIALGLVAYAYDEGKKVGYRQAMQNMPQPPAAHEGTPSGDLRPRR